MKALFDRHAALAKTTSSTTTAAAETLTTTTTTSNLVPSARVLAQRKNSESAANIQLAAGAAPPVSSKPTSGIVDVSKVRGRRQAIGCVRARV